MCVRVCGGQKQAASQKTKRHSELRLVIRFLPFGRTTHPGLIPFGLGHALRCVIRSLRTTRGRASPRVERDVDALCFIKFRFVPALLPAFASSSTSSADSFPPAAASCSFILQSFPLVVMTGPPWAKAHWIRTWFGVSERDAAIFSTTGSSGPPRKWTSAVPAPYACAHQALSSPARGTRACRGFDVVPGHEFEQRLGLVQDVRVELDPAQPSVNSLDASGNSRTG